MRDLNITLVQTPLHWQQPDANRAMLEEKLWQAESDADLIILPEMFTTGFSMEAAKLAEPMNFKTLRWMRQMAEQMKAVICGSFIVNDSGQYFNRLVWMQPDGQYSYYDKRHLFRMADEHEHYSPGHHKITPTLNGWTICPFICYDLRFPVWSRNIQDGNQPIYDLAIYVANWPAARVNAWDTLLRARAIENLSYVVGVNRIGSDNKGIEYNGHSAVITPKGDEQIFMSDREETITTSLKANEVIQLREKFPAHLDADSFTLQ